MKEFVTKYLDKKMTENEEYIRITFYELRVKNNLSEVEENEFLRLSKIRLENMNYRVFFTGAKFNYQEASRKVEDNELMIAIKDKSKEEIKSGRKNK